MSDALRKALGLLCEARGHLKGYKMSMLARDRESLLTAIDAALAAPAELQQPHKYGADVHCPMIPCAVCDTPAELQQPVAQEPVAWRWRARGSTHLWVYDPAPEWLAEQSRLAIECEPLYAAPMVADAARAKAIERQFPMQGGPSIPWSLAELLYAGYSACHGKDQSLERLAERGGFGWNEVTFMWTNKPSGKRFQEAYARALAKGAGS